MSHMGRFSPVTELAVLCFFLSGALMLGSAAWLGVCAAGLAGRGLLESTLGWLLLALAWIAGAGVVLGFTGGLGRAGFFWLPAGGLVALLWWRQKKSSEDGRQWRAWLAGWGKLLGGGSVEGRVTAGLLLGLLLLAVLAAQAEPVVFDALTYRLSRIGQWLQDGRIAPFATDDPRLNYMPVVPDLVIAWLLGATSEGFHLAPLSQLVGGGLLLGATFGLARLAGLDRRLALGAVALVLGMANVAVQFTTIHSDLFTAGVFAASYVLWHRALLRGEGSWVAGIGIGLAFGSKGTMFYLAPGVALWVGWLAWQHRRDWRALRPTAGAAALAIIVFAGPVHARNLATYGGWFGPREAVVLHHGESLAPAQRWHKLGINLGTSAVQLLDPNSQPFWAQTACRALGRSLLPVLPGEADRDVFAQYPRRAQVEMIMDLREPDADLVSCGVLAVALFLGGMVAAMAGRTRTDAQQILIWGAGTIAYVLTQHALVQWHQWAFRFMVLAAPWLAVVGAWGISRLGRRGQIAAWAVVVISAGQVFATVQGQANQAAWQACARPDRALSHFVYSRWREWAAGFDAPGVPLTVALPINAPLAAFYRQPAGQRVRLAPVPAATISTAEQFLSDKPGWAIVPAGRFMGREGRVQGRVFRYFGQDGRSLYSLAAYRRLQPGEVPAPLLYRALRTGQPARTTDDLFVRSWTGTVRLRLRHQSGPAWKFTILAPDERQEGVLAAGESREVTLRLPVDSAAQVLVDFFATGPAANGSGAAPNVELLP